MDESRLSLPWAEASQVERDSRNKPTEQNMVWKEVQDLVLKKKKLILAEIRQIQAVRLTVLAQPCIKVPLA